MKRNSLLSRMVLCMGALFMIHAGMVWAAPIELKVATGSGTKGFMYLTLKAATDYVEQKSQGKVKFTYFTDGSLLKYTETYRGIVDGVADIGDVIIGNYAGQFPKSTVLELTPGYGSGVKNGKDNAFLAKKFLLDEWKDVKVLYASAVPGNNLITAKKPVRSLADAKGMRIRAGGPGLNVVKAWGSIPVTLDTGEMYEALQKGIVDGVLTNESGFISLKLADVCKYSNQIYGTQTAAMVILNQKSYNALPEDVKKIFDELMDWIPEVGGKISEEMSHKGIEALLAKGGQVITYSPEAYTEFINALKDINKQWADGLEAKGLPGKMLLSERNKLLGIQ